MHQDIEHDPFDLDDWDFAAADRVDAGRGVKE
jgi:hypothetical protein